MNHDLFLDCPQCSHTIKVSSDLVGVLVQCPDCANEFKVPEIRDGLNPRLKGQQRSAPGRSLHSSGLPGEVARLEEGLRSLLRRQQEQNKQLELIQGNAELVCKQLKLLEKPALEADADVLQPKLKEEPPPVSPFPWMTLSKVCAWLTAGGAALLGVLYLRSL